ncbi:Anaphase-promoting complex subunit 4 [Blattella germanica]|nr:Anaphase-promoting complex subunit 4 [Blattella germanica]
MASSNAMRQLEERHVATKVELMVWSNKMDLLALSNVRGEVALHRLTWQKVWSLSPPTEGTSVKGMAWRPDGKVIAIAYSNSDILLIDVENKETLHTSHVDGEITCINWVQEKDPSDQRANSIHRPKDNPGKYVIQDSSRNFLPKLPSLSRSFGSVNKCIEENLEDAKKIKDQTHLNILLVGVNTGKLYLSIFGLFPSGVVDMNEHVNGQFCCILDADVSEDLNMIFVVLFYWKEDDELKEGKRELALVLLDTPVLQVHAQELHALALKHGHIVSLLDYLAHTMHSITEAWENILLEMDSKLASYAATVPEGSVSSDFLDLLMFGMPSDELEMFLLQDLTEKGLKKLGHSIELSYSNIQKLVLKHLHSVGQSLAYHLAELRGMARCRDRYEMLGLQEETVSNSFRAAGSFLVKATEVQQVIDNSMKNYKVFFRWLYVVILRLTDERVPAEITKITQQDLAFIAEFLHNFDGMKQDEENTPSGSSRKPRFNLERLGQYLVDQELTIPPDTDENPWTKLLQTNEFLSNHPSIVPHYRNMSLVQQHNHLKKAISNVFSQPEVAIGQQFKMFSIIKCLHTSQIGDAKLTHINVVDEQKLLLAFLDSTSRTEGFYLMEVPTDKFSVLGDDASARCVYFYFNPPTSKAEEDGRGDEASWSAPMKVLDVQFYLQDVLSVLLEQNSESRGALFVQFPMRVALQVASPVSLQRDDTKHLLTCAPRIEASVLLEAGALRPVENMVASRFAVSGSRKVAVVLSESRRKVRLFEMEVEEEEEDEEAMDGTTTTLRDSDTSMIDVSKGSEGNEEEWSKTGKHMEESEGNTA